MLQLRRLFAVAQKSVCYSSEVCILQLRSVYAVAQKCVCCSSEVCTLQLRSMYAVAQKSLCYSTEVCMLLRSLAVCYSSDICLLQLRSLCYSSEVCMLQLRSMYAVAQKSVHYSSEVCMLQLRSLSALAQKFACYSEVCLYAIAQQSVIAQEFTNRLLMTEMSVPSPIISCKIHDDHSGTETGVSPSFFHVLLLIILPLLHSDPPLLLWNVVVWQSVFASLAQCLHYLVLGWSQCKYYRTKKIVLYVMMF